MSRAGGCGPVVGVLVPPDFFVAVYTFHSPIWMLREPNYVRSTILVDCIINRDICPPPANELLAEHIQERRGLVP